MALVRQDKTSRRRNQPVVTVAGHAYLVTMADRSTHRVSKDRRCDCPQGARCPAVRAVARYLHAGGRRAPDPLLAPEPPAPAASVVPLLACPICPICGQPTAPPAPGQPAVAFACPTVPSHWIEWRAAQVLTKRCAQQPWPEWTAADRAAWLQDRYQDLLDLYRDGPSIFS